MKQPEYPLGGKQISKLFAWVESVKRERRIAIWTYKVYRTRKALSGNNEDTDAVRQVAAKSSMVQLTCWHCLDDFNLRSRRGEDPDYRLAFGEVSIGEALAGLLPNCKSCNRPMSLSGSLENVKKYLVESEDHVRSSLAFQSARIAAKLRRGKTVAAKT
jgi:hypothetical protein